MEDNRQNKFPARNGSAPPDRSAHRGGGSWRRVVTVFGLLLLVFAALFVYGYHHYLQRVRAVEATVSTLKNSVPVVNVEKARQAPAVQEIILPGNVTPVTEASVYARASGYVRRRLADIGDRVREGQLLAEIEAPEMEQQVQQARAALAQSEKQLEQSRADLEEIRARMELARVTWDRYRVLVDHGAVSRQEGDQQLAAFRSASASVNSVEARIGSAAQNVKASRASLERLVALQDFLKVRAPFGGAITARNFDVGALISGSGGSLGQSPGTGGPSGPSTGAQGGELFRIAQTGVVRVLTNVPETDAPGIRVGQRAVVLPQAFPGRQFAGRITRTANAVDMSSRTMLTEVQVQNPDLVLLPGMFVQVRLMSARVAPPPLVSGNCVLVTAKGLCVAVLEDLPQQDAQSPDGGRPPTYPQQAKRIHLQEIQVGRDFGQELEVIGGLKGWEYVVSNPGDDIVEGAVVQPRASAKSEGAGGQRRGNEARQTPASK